MKLTTIVLIMTFVGVALFGVQALVWRNGARGRTETDIQNRTGRRYPVTEVPVLAGSALLLLAGTILCIPRPSDPD